MIWLAYRQLRVQIFIVLGVLVALAITLAITGPHLVHVFDVDAAACRSDGVSAANCNNGVVKIDRILQPMLNLLVLGVPVLLGMFWGAPLIARELETGTFRLSLTQSETRTRWLAMRLALVFGISAVVSGLVSLMVGWWMSPIDTVDANRFSNALFGQRGFVPIGYALFAVALGVTFGLIIRRTVPAMAATLVAFIAARLSSSLYVRPHFMSPKVLSLPIGSGGAGLGLNLTNNGTVSVQAGNPPYLPNAWDYSQQLLDSGGHPPSESYLQQACPNLGANLPGPGPVGAKAVQAPSGANNAFQHCATKLAAHFHEIVKYQPANRYWAFQGIETAFFIVAALALSAFCFWWVKRRLI
jgi:ABC-type transport system involved in multi-copper enzyme maturation permease subunit